MTVWGSVTTPETGAYGRTETCWAERYRSHNRRALCCAASRLVHAGALQTRAHAPAILERVRDAPALRALRCADVDALDRPSELPFDQT
jgi:hypothetical protein